MFKNLFIILLINKSMKNIVKIIILIIIIIILLAGFFFIKNSITANAIKQQENTDRLNTYTYTKAICDESNFCQDNEITCQGNEIKSIIPITGEVIQHSQDWQDPRTEQDKNKLC